MPRTRELAYVWWLHPAWLAALAALPGLMLAQFTSSTNFEVSWGAGKYFTTTHFTISLLMLAVLGMSARASFNSVRTRRRAVNISLTDRQLVTARTAATWTFRLTTAAYVMWLVIGLSRGLNPLEAVGILTGEAGSLANVKSTLAPVAGVTTFTQLGGVCAACLMLIRRLGYAEGTSWRLGVLLGLALTRSLVYAERLAIIEVLLPMVVIILCVRPSMTARPTRKRLRRVLVSLSPLWAPVLLLVVFGAFEYFRSWSTYYGAIGDQGFAEFIVNRLGGYYATSSNNSAILMEHAKPLTGFLPWYVLEFVWNSPVVAWLQPQSWFDADPVTTQKWAFAFYGNAEFNNTGGLLVPVMDLTIAGAVGFWAAVGWIAGKLYARVVSGSIGSLLTFSVLVIGLLELGRFVYWTQGRAFVPIVAACIIAVALNRGANEPSRSINRRMKQSN